MRCCHHSCCSTCACACPSCSCPAAAAAAAAADDNTIVWERNLVVDEPSFGYVQHDAYDDARREPEEQETAADFFRAVQMRCRYVRARRGTESNRCRASSSSAPPPEDDDDDDDDDNDDDDDKDEDGAGVVQGGGGQGRAGRGRAR